MGTEETVVFAAYQPRPARKYRRTVTLGAVALLAIAITLLVRDRRDVHRVVTRHGIRTLKPGMSIRDVDGIMGQPLIGTNSDGLQCYRYGMPSLDVPQFTLYETCFESGKLVRVTEHSYSASEVEPPPTPSQESADRSR
ncbi:MAG: hypothetical protein ACT4TC_09945 [Myxococcaceae bacterium]